MAITLAQAKAYLIERGRAPLGDIATRFDSSPDATRQVMQHWVAKGRAKILACGPCKSGCACAERPDEVYEWVA